MSTSCWCGSRARTRGCTSRSSRSSTASWGSRATRARTERLSGLPRQSDLAVAAGRFGAFDQNPDLGVHSEGVAVTIQLGASAPLVLGSTADLDLTVPQRLERILGDHRSLLDRGLARRIVPELQSLKHFTNPLIRNREHP